MPWADFTVELDGRFAAGRVIRTVDEWQISRRQHRGHAGTRCLGTGEELCLSDRAVMVIANGLCPNFVTSLPIVERYGFGHVVLRAVNRIRALAEPLRFLVEAGVLDPAEISGIGLPTQMLPLLEPPPKRSEE